MWVLKSRNFNTYQSFWHYLDADITERYDAADIISQKYAFFAFEQLGQRKNQYKKIEGVCWISYIYN